MCDVYKKEIIPNPLFWSSGLLFVILSIYRKMYSGDTREGLLIGYAPSVCNTLSNPYLRQYSSR